ncbi:MAG: hypothetical protein ACM3XO_10760 [Bacteroidota bacterium]|jgi:hypothetical protein
MSSKTVFVILLVILLARLLYSSGTAGVMDTWTSYGIRYARLDDGFVYDMTICPRDRSYQYTGISYRAIGVDLALGNIPTHLLLSCGIMYQGDAGPLPN